jgi:hypothetical protein
MNSPRSYGGIYERGAREYTLDDFYSVQLDKLDKVICLKESGIMPEEGVNDESDDDEDDEDDDDNEDDGESEGTGVDDPKIIEHEEDDNGEGSSGKAGHEQNVGPALEVPVSSTCYNKRI